MTNVDGKLLSLLMEIAMLNYNKGFLNESSIIFDAVSYCKPESAYPLIGIARVQMYKGEFENAISTLRNASCQDYMQRELRDSFLGKALILADYREEAYTILNNIVEQGKYDVAIRFASDLLFEIKK
ncbi:tetratricopeptide repeat protein [Desulfosarcina variabilis]|uniref:tetratricopeptide repeat protein n=1 Tax=Desulfosarcina variabilis TaxID=2300 RepID=UPI003AFA6D22